MTSEQAKAAAELMTTVWEGEFPATCQVLAAVKNDNRNYKPDAAEDAWKRAVGSGATTADPASEIHPPPCRPQSWRRARHFPGATRNGESFELS